MCLSSKFRSFIGLLIIFASAMLPASGDASAESKQSDTPPPPNAESAETPESIGTGDGKIHIIPALSPPSVKNGGKLAIQAVVKALAGVREVRAEILDGDRVVDSLNLTAGSGEMGGAPDEIMGPFQTVAQSAMATIGLWSAEWAAHGLEEKHYQVRLRVTDVEGYWFEDASLTFSDPVAGGTIPGTTAYPNGGLTRIGALTLNPGEGYLTSAVIDTTTGYAYFGTQTSPGMIVKVALNDSGVPTRVGALTLDPGEDLPRKAVIDSAAGYAYFGTQTSPGKVVKVSLGAGAALPTRVGALTLNPAEIRVYSAAIDSAAGYAYFGTDTSPGRVVKVDLNGSGVPTRVGALTLSAGENVLTSASIDPVAGYAYFGTQTSPGRVVKVDLNGSGIPIRVGATTLSSGEDSLFSSEIDAVAGYVYFGASPPLAAPGRVVKVAMGAGAAVPTRVGAITLDSGEIGLPGCAGIDTANGLAYFVTGNSPGRVVKVALGTGVMPPTRVGAITLNPGEGFFVSAVIDTAAGYAYFGTDNTSQGIVTKIGLSQNGNVKGTKVTLSEVAVVTDLHFYSHAASGNIRLAIYDDAATKTLLWESGVIANSAAGAFVDVPISSGTPSALTLDAGTYSLAWQVDTNADVPSYTLGGGGDGFFLGHGFGAFPSAITSGAVTNTNETWTEYITYDLPPLAAHLSWIRYR